MLIVTVGILFSSKVYMVEAYQCSLQPHCGMRVSSKHKVEFYLLVDLAFLTKAYRFSIIWPTEERFETLPGLIR